MIQGLKPGQTIPDFLLRQMLMPAGTERIVQYEVGSILNRASLWHKRLSDSICDIKIKETKSLY